MPQAVQAAQITEVMYDLEGSDDKREWIELYNDTVETLDLSNWSITIGSETSKHGLNFTTDKGGRGSGVISPGEYIIVASDAATMTAEYSSFTGQLADSVMNLPNYSSSRLDPVAIQLFNEKGDQLSEAWYLPLQSHPAGHSLEWLDGHWVVSALGGSPGQAAAVRSVAAFGQFRLIALMPNPDGADTDNEWVSIENHGSTEALLDGWYVTDKPTSSGTVHKQVVPTGTSLKPGEQYRLQLSGSFLNNSDEEVSLYRPDGTLVETVYFSGSVQEGVIYMRSADGWRWGSDSQVSTVVSPGNTAPAPNTTSTKSTPAIKTSAANSPRAVVTKSVISPSPKSTATKKQSPSPSMPTAATQVAGLSQGPPVVQLSPKTKIVLLITVMLVLLSLIFHRFQLYYRLSDWVRYGILRKK